MVERVRRSGSAGRPELADFVVMEHEGIDGARRVHRRAFEKTWEQRGWRIVVAEDPPEEQARPEPSVVADAARRPGRAPKTDIATSEES